MLLQKLKEGIIFNDFTVDSLIIWKLNDRYYYIGETVLPIIIELSAFYISDSGIDLDISWKINKFLFEARRK